VRKREPRVFEKTRHVLLPKDYIRYRMTGELATEVGDASGTSLLNVKRRTVEQDADRQAGAGHGEAAAAMCTNRTRSPAS
jgi:sugar (pentulose or hexulose) kinase